jgi:hypothetical protein
MELLVQGADSADILFHTLFLQMVGSIGTVHRGPRMPN